MLVVATPSAAPELWTRYVDGAVKSYARHGVSRAIDPDEVASGATTTLFYAVLDRDGHMLGGVRAQGPYAVIEESHVLEEWRGSPGYDLVVDQLRTRLPEGIVEMKTAWVDDSAPGKAVSSRLARTALPTLAFTGARFLFASAADHVLRQWQTSGGRISEQIPAAAYPTDRYRTRLMWWDRESIAEDADGQVLASMKCDLSSLTGAEGRYTESSSAPGSHIWAA